MRILKMLVVVLSLATVMCTSAVGQTVDHGKFEFSMLGGVTIAMPERGENSTIFAIPHGAAGAWLVNFPAFRMSMWTESALIFDFGFSFFTISEDEDDATLLNMEGAVGGAFDMEDSKISPFIQGLVGFFSLSNGDTESEFYLGGQGGIRFFINDHTAGRFQIGYRHMMGDELDFDTVEIAGGISFFP